MHKIWFSIGSNDFGKDIFGETELFQNLIFKHVLSAETNIINEYHIGFQKQKK